MRNQPNKEITCLILALAMAMQSPAPAAASDAAGGTGADAGYARRAEDDARTGCAGRREYERYAGVIRSTENMVFDSRALDLARQHGLQILNLTWEDTGRYKNSAVGPNISDMTIQVQQNDPYSDSYSLHCMPVIRFPNFSDRTADIPLDRFFLLVGNEKGGRLKSVTLREFLGDLRSYLHDPDSWEGGKDSLLAPRDTHALVSAQACFLPISEGGTAQFNPVLFNYQSVEADPAVLTVLVTREGASVTVIDNKRDTFPAGPRWGQRLFFNINGKRAGLTGTREGDFRRQSRPSARGNRSGAAGGPDSRSDSGDNLNMVLLIQVPLKQKRPLRPPYCCAMMDASAKFLCKEERSNVENAVIGHGKTEGPFTEIDGLAIERDPAYPIRVTVQFYKATSNGVVSEQDMAQIAAQIEKVYARADYVGSLVLGGATGRPTEYTGDKYRPRGWWQAFWKRHHENLGRTAPEQAPAWGLQ